MAEGDAGGLRWCQNLVSQGAVADITLRTQSISCACLTGLTRKAPTPAARNNAVSQRGPNEVMSSNRVPEISGASLMARARLSPSMSGICMSRIASANGSLLAASCRSFARASEPLDAPTGRMPRAAVCWRRMFRFVSLSSTMSKRRPAKRNLISGTTAVRSCFSNLALNQNVEPLPGVLSTPIWPPIISTSCLEIARPRPVPPYLRVVEPSACEKAWNKYGSPSGAMPMPVSVTVKQTVTWVGVSLSRVTRRATSPSSVNLIPLTSRLVMTWRSRPGSPRNSVGTSS